MSIEGTSSVGLREQCMQRRFVPLAREVFARLPEVQSIAYLIGQFWCDEAEDAVHEEIATFTERDARWPEADDEAADRARLARAFADSKHGWFGFIEQFPALDDNGSAITAFASFCPEGCDQEMARTEAYVVYAWARRGAGGEVALEIVGRMLRPEWEDRFDVGEHAIEQTAAAAAPPPRRRGLLGFLHRLFGH